ncbi:hypothetical protein P4573_14230, partial [Priestia megaterium]|nr:hypothetical protein [Priestia megaterium]MED4182948.1 hypothetical protein [Priestia megaterium]
LTLLRGLTCSAFPAGVLVLRSNQQLEAIKSIKLTFTITIKSSERFIVRSFLQLTYFLSQPI